MTSSSSSEESEVSVHVKKSPKPKGDSSEPNKSKLDPDLMFYREVDMSDLPSQYTEDIETFRQVLNLPYPRDSITVSHTTVWGLNTVASEVGHRPRGPSAMLPVCPTLKEALDKFEQDFQVANLPEGKFIKSPSTFKWYKLGQPCFEDNLQEWNLEFVKICISPKPSGAPMGKVPLQGNQRV